MNKVEDAFPGDEGDKLLEALDAKASGIDRATMHCIVEDASGNVPSILCVSATRVVGKATEAEIESLPKVVAFLVEGGARLNLRKNASRSSANQTPVRTPAFRRKARAPDVTSAAREWRRFQQPAPDRQEKFEACIATEADLQRVHPNLHALLAAIPEPDEKLGVGVNAERGKFNVRYQMRTAGIQGQAQVRHGTYVDKPLAMALARWLRRQPLATKMDNLALRRFAEELFPLALSKKDPWIGVDLRVVDDVLSLVSGSPTTRALAEGHGLPPTFRIAKVEPRSMKIVARDGRLIKTVPIPYLQSPYAPDHDWQIDYVPCRRRFHFHHGRERRRGKRVPAHARRDGRAAQRAGRAQRPLSVAARRSMEQLTGPTMAWRKRWRSVETRSSRQ